MSLSPHLLTCLVSIIFCFTLIAARVVQPPEGPSVHQARNTPSMNTWTNAERLKRGLPPKAPTRAYGIPSRNGPRDIYGSGNIAVSDSDGQPMGFVSYNGNLAYGLTSTNTSATRVTIPGTATTPHILTAVTDPYAMPQGSNLASVASGSGNDDLGATMATYDILSGTSYETPKGSPSVIENNPREPQGVYGVQSTIWFLDTNRVLTAWHCNSDGTCLTPIYFFYVEDEDEIRLTGDLNLAEEYTPVTFTVQLAP